MVNTLTGKCLERIYNNKCKINPKKLLISYFFCIFASPFYWDEAFNEV